jgi:HSP20 family protein
MPDVAFIRWEPLHDLLALQRAAEASGEYAAGWTPAVDVYETDDHYGITAEVPGLSRDNILIQLRNGQLILEGERPTSGVSCERYHRIERGHGRFSRAFSLPDAINPENITADLKDGVLTIRVPKAPPHRISVR